MPEVSKILVVDELPVVRYALQSVFAGSSKYSIVGEAEDISHAMSLISKLRPDIIIMDFLSMKETFASVADILNGQGVNMLAFTLVEDWKMVNEFINAGGIGVVSKKSPISEVRSALDVYASGRKWISPRFRDVRIKKIIPEVSAPLSERENEIVALLAKGYTSKQMADLLCLSVRTVENHRHRIFKRLGIERSAQLVSYAFTNNLLHTGDVS